MARRFLSHLVDRANSRTLPGLRALSEDQLTEIAQKVAARQQREATWTSVWNGEQPVCPLPPALPPPAPVHRRAARAPEPHIVVRPGEVPDGFSRVASAMYRKGHHLWEMRQASDGEFHLVRLREERLADMFDQPRQASAGHRRTAQLGGEMDLAENIDDGAPVALDGGDGSDEMQADHLTHMYDMHEVMHGRPPHYSDGPEFDEMGNVVQDAQQADDGAGDGAGDDFLLTDGSDGGDGGEAVEAPEDLAPVLARYRPGMRFTALRDGEPTEGIVILVIGDEMIGDFGDGDEMVDPFDILGDDMLDGILGFDPETDPDDGDEGEAFEPEEEER